MKKSVKIFIWTLGILSFLIIGLMLELYREAHQSYLDDLKACPLIKPDQAAYAVHEDVLRQGNKLFSKYHLTAEDIHIDLKTISIGQSSVLVQFRITPEPYKLYFGMPACGDLRDVEYGSEDLKKPAL